MNLSIVGRADRAAEQNRARFDLNGVFAVSLVAPPGAGKAALVRRTCERLADNLNVLRIEIGGAPPLPAHRLGHALAELRLRDADLLFVENAGDFVCPGTYKLGAHASVRVSTVFDEDPLSTHAHDLYRGLEALVVNKIDRAHEAGFDQARFLRALAKVNPNLMVFFTSCADGRGVQSWVDWVERRRRALFRLPATAASSPHREEAFA